MRIRRLAKVAVAVFMAGTLAACTTTHTPDHAPDSVPAPEQTEIVGDIDAAGAVFVVRTQEREWQLAPSEWQVMDDFGTDVASPPDIGSPDRVYVFVPIGEWSFGPATMYTGNAMHSCSGITVDADYEELGNGWYEITPHGPAGAYTLEFAAGSGPTSGLSPRTGGMTGSVLWTTTPAQADAPLGQPEVSMSLLTDESGTLEASDLQLEIANVYPPVDVELTVTVTAANGEALTFQPESTGVCIGSSINFVVSYPETQRVLQLGDAPFTYDVELSMNGETHRGSAEWSTGPGDVPVEFDAPLS